VPGGEQRERGGREEEEGEDCWTSEHRAGLYVKMLMGAGWAPLLITARATAAAAAAAAASVVVNTSCDKTKTETKTGK